MTALHLSRDTERDAPVTGQLMTPAQLATFLQVDTERLYDMRAAGTGPRFKKIGRDVRYAWPDVREWLDAITQDRTTGKASRCA